MMGTFHQPADARRRGGAQNCMLLLSVIFGTFKASVVRLHCLTAAFIPGRPPGGPWARVRFHHAPVKGPGPATSF